MSDQALRTLERALASGEEAARLPLATAYLRQGRCRAAAGLLAGLVALPGEALEVLQAAWCQTLSGLAPRARAPGVRAYGTVLSWEDEGRTAVLHPAGGSPVSWLLERGGMQVAARRETPAVAQELRARVRERLAPAEAPHLSARVAAALRRAPPLRAAGLRVVPRLRETLPDGRIVWADPLVVLSPSDAPAERAWLPDPGGRFEGPVRLSADGAALLGFVNGRPARVPLEPGPRRAPLPPGEGSGVWHPRADVAATLPPHPRASELLTAEGQLLLRLPQDARPLGFTPEGTELLVLRAFQPPSTGVLEVWGGPGEPAEAA